jgi:hypothetical protein
MQAAEANAPAEWDRLWSAHESRDWRAHAMSRVYTRIDRLLPKGGHVADLGGGIGALADCLAVHDRTVAVYDHSRAALHQAKTAGHKALRFDLENEVPEIGSGTAVVATELLEHLSAEARQRIYEAAASGKALFSVPNNRLSPDEEPQHTISFTAKSFGDELREYFHFVRVEVLGAYLLGVCGFPKHFTLSVCMPARDEAADIERVLASFRGVADQLVVGIDPRTEDNTREICERYCDLIFDLDEPRGPESEKQPGVHFAHIRNQCMDHCTGDWIFMSEAHEHLQTGEDVLLQLDTGLPQMTTVAYVMRTGNGQRWGFPWLCKNRPDHRYSRAVHNQLKYPQGAYVVRLPEVVTLHDRAKDRAMARSKQRKAQNRKTLLEDWRARGAETSLFYLGSEWREYDKDRARQRLEQLLALPSKNGAIRYQARLILAKLLVQQNERAEAAAVLLRCCEDDWSRTEHWLWLGDLAWEAEDLERALQYYRHCATTWNEPPFSLWWIDLSHYGYLIAQRLAMTYGHLGRGEDALLWAERCLDTLPDDAPAETLDEARSNVKQLREAIGNENGSE